MNKKSKGFTLLISMVLTSVLLIIGFVVINISVKQIIISSSNQESQYAFYNTDSGTECAIYWDLPKDGSPSAFAPTSTSTISCNNSTITPSHSAIVGGISTSTFTVNFTKGCAVVDVVKNTITGGTTIESHGFNTCAANALRRYERGIKIQY